MSKAISYITGAILSFVLLVFVSTLLHPAYADPYDCYNYGTHQCINLTLTPSCNNGKPSIHLAWNNPNNDSQFNIVYTHDGHWYMKPIWSKTTSTDIPTYGGYQDGGSAGDPGFQTAVNFSAKITGGIPHWMGGYGITTGYSTPDKTTSIDCTPKSTPPPTPPPTGTPTPAPSQGPLPTTGAVTVQFETLGPDSNGNILKPLHPNRQLVLYFYTDTAFQHLAYQSTLDSTSIVSFNTAGYFANAAFPLTGLPSGSYYILVKSPQGSLMAQIGSGDGTGPIAITGGQNNILVDPTQNSQNTTADTTIPLLQMGDLYADGTDFNNVSLQDWNIVKDCFGSTATAMSAECSSHTGMLDPTTHVFLPDMNDDGVVDGIDYTILMRHFGQYGAGQTAKIN